MKTPQTPSINFPKWAPIGLIELINQCQFELSLEENKDHPYKELMIRDVAIWTRLATRPEMESVWEFFFKAGEYHTLATPEKIIAWGGIIGSTKNKIQNFEIRPKLTEAEFEEDMNEIALLSEKLSRKLRKHCVNSLNPFSPSNVLGKENIKHITKILDKQFTTPQRRYDTPEYMAFYLINRHFPSLADQISNLSQIAKAEAIEQSSRTHNLPRKLNDKNAFRTFFITTIANYFIFNAIDYSPTIVAKFCSVGLDDPDINADLVRKLVSIDDETKTMLKNAKDFKKGKI